MIEQMMAGVIHGITEWLPIKASAIVSLTKKAFWGSFPGIENLSTGTLFVYLGTFFAALIYFRKEIIVLIKGLFTFPSANKETQGTLRFLIISTVLSGWIGFALIQFLSAFEKQVEIGARLITLFVGVALLTTGYLELKNKKHETKGMKDLTLTDAIILGVVQGISLLPGFSRAGLTIAALLFRRVHKIDTLKLIFLMSLPIIFTRHLMLNTDLHLIKYNVLAIAVSFIVSWAVIYGLLQLAKRFNFGYFVMFFGTLTLIAAVL